MQQSIDEPEEKQAADGADQDPHELLPSTIPSARLRSLMAEAR